MVDCSCCGCCFFSFNHQTHSHTYRETHVCVIDDCSINIGCWSTLIWLLQVDSLVDLTGVLPGMLDDFQAHDRYVKWLDRGADRHGICIFVFYISFSRGLVSAKMKWLSLKMKDDDDRSNRRHHYHSWCNLPSCIEHLWH